MGANLSYSKRPEMKIEVIVFFRADTLRELLSDVDTHPKAIGITTGSNTKDMDNNILGGSFGRDNYNRLLNALNEGHESVHLSFDLRNYENATAFIKALGLERYRQS